MDHQGKSHIFANMKERQVLHQLWSWFLFFKKKDNPPGQNKRGKNIIWDILHPVVVFAFKVGNTVYTGFPDDASGKNSPANTGDIRDVDSVPGWGRSHGGEHGNPLQSSALAWKIPRTEKPGGLQSIGLQRIRHNWSIWLAHMHGFYSWEIICIHFLHTYKNW